MSRTWFIRGVMAVMPTTSGLKLWIFLVTIRWYYCRSLKSRSLT